MVTGPLGTQIFVSKNGLLFYRFMVEVEFPGVIYIGAARNA